MNESLQKFWPILTRVFSDGPTKAKVDMLCDGIATSTMDLKSLERFVLIDELLEEGYIVEVETKVNPFPAFRVAPDRIRVTPKAMAELLAAIGYQREIFGRTFARLQAQQAND